MVLVDEILESVVLVRHDRGHKGGGNLSNCGVVGVQEGIFEGHDVVANEAAFGNDEEGCLRSCPAIPMKKQVALGPGYPPNIIGSNGPVFSVDSACDVGYNDEEVGGTDGVTEHIAKEDNLG